MTIRPIVLLLLVSIAIGGCKQRQETSLVSALGRDGAAPAKPASAKHTPETLSFSGTTMGTTFSVKVVKTSQLTSDDKALAELVQRTLDRVDGRMSTYKADSEISQLNAAVADAPFEVSPETFAVLSLAQQVTIMSDGAFDVTVGKLVRAWGFGAGGDFEKNRVAVMTDAELQALAEDIGFDKLNLDREKSTVTKQRAGLRIDLSAIAKGYGVDAVAETLSAAGAQDFMVEVGGEVHLSGNSPRGGPWKIAVEKPNDSVGRRKLQEVIHLVRASVATSGDYRNFYMQGGRRVSHTVDPRTLRPIEHQLASVTVVHESCALADALATALNVMGPIAGLKMAKRENLAAFFIVRQDDGSFETFGTPAFEPLLAASAAPH